MAGENGKSIFTRIKCPACGNTDIYYIPTKESCPLATIVTSICSNEECRARFKIDVETRNIVDIILKNQPDTMNSEDDNNDQVEKTKPLPVKPGPRQDRKRKSRKGSGMPTGKKTKPKPKPKPTDGKLFD